MDYKGYYLGDVTETRNKEGKLTMNKMDVYHNGIRIGSIVGEYREWAKQFLYRYVLIADDSYYNERGYADSKTISACKKALIEAYEKFEHKTSSAGKSRVHCRQLPEFDKDFYPTPSWLCGMLFSEFGVKINGQYFKRDVKYVLEPSAGKGDMIENYFSYLNKDWRDSASNVDLDAVEIDPNLQAILKGKGIRVVSNDFLQYNTNKKYDLIIMNPCFSDGCRHLLKAIDMQRNGGQIACILNAETILNPFSNERKVLVQQLKKYNAKIKYVDNAFSKSERKSDVRVALIWINIPNCCGESEILSRLKKADESEKRAKNIEITDVTLGNFVDGIVSRFNFESKLITELIREYEAVKPYILRNADSSYQYNSPILSLKIGDSDYNGINDAIRMLRHKFWEELLNNDELTDRFTATLRSKYQQMISDMSDYDFNHFNVYQVIERMRSDVFGGIKEEIYKVFDKLSEEYSYYPESGKTNVHYFNGWKTNKAHKVGMKAIIPAYGVFASNGWTSSYSCVEAAYKALGDIEKVLNYLDLDITADVDLIATLKRNISNGITKNISCKYFSVTFYKKGTVHIKMHPEAERVIDALNIYVCKGRNWLPPCYGKVPYDNMTEEEQRIIDEFQGKEKYKQVTDNPQLYFFDENGNDLPLAQLTVSA